MKIKSFGPELSEILQEDGERLKRRLAVRTSLPVNCNLIRGVLAKKWVKIHLWDDCFLRRGAGPVVLVGEHKAD